VTLKRWIAGVALLAGLGAVTALAMRDDNPSIDARAPEQRPMLALLTSLPLVFSERFGLDSGGSPALTRLEQRYDVVPIGVADAASLSGQHLLLMAHPRAQPAEALVDLDRWVRSGGRLVLLADPKLDWDSDRPVGDRLRPPPAFADTGLLAHWGMTLSGPTTDGQASTGNGEIETVASSPGSLSGKTCNIVGEGFVARCRIGRGAATIIADADFLKGEPQNLDLLLDELARLESR
jgi:hypothetical protein